MTNARDVSHSLTTVYAVGLGSSGRRAHNAAGLSSTRRSLAAAGVLASLVVLVPLASSLPARAASFPTFDHVFVIVMENHSYNQIIGSSAAPYTNSLAATGGLATNYFGVAHPSLPNYLALTGGSTFGITSDCTTCWVSAPNIADNLESAGSSWKAYEESMPSPCFVGDSYPYVQKHDPFIYFNDIRTNSSRCQSHVVPYAQLASDLNSTATTPNYAFITPNMCNDTHDCSIGTGDSWLQQQVPQILSSPAFAIQHSLLALTWDEDDFSGTNQVPLILVGSGVGTGVKSSTAYDHYSLLHTFEAARGAATLSSNDAGATVMSDFISASPPPLPPAVVNSITPQTGLATGGTSVTINGSGLSTASKVNFGSQPAASFNVVSDTQMTAVSPPQTPGTVDVTVTAASTSAMSPADQFTVNRCFQVNTRLLRRFESWTRETGQVASRNWGQGRASTCRWRAWRRAVCQR